MAMIDRTPLLVICDAGPLIHLDEVGCLDLLSDCLEVLVPPRVWQEVERHRPAALCALAEPREAPLFPLCPPVQNLPVACRIGEWVFLAAIVWQGWIFGKS